MFEYNPKCSNRAELHRTTQTIDNPHTCTCVRACVFARILVTKVQSMSSHKYLYARVCFHILILCVAAFLKLGVFVHTELRNEEASEPDRNWSTEKSDREGYTPGASHWVRQARCVTRGASCRVRHTGYVTLGASHWVCHAGCVTRGTSCWVHHAGCITLGVSRRVHHTG